MEKIQCTHAVKQRNGTVIRCPRYSVTGTFLCPRHSSERIEGHNRVYYGPVNLKEILNHSTPVQDVYLKQAIKRGEKFRVPSSAYAGPINLKDLKYYIINPEAKDIDRYVKNAIRRGEKFVLPYELHQLAEDSDVLVGLTEAGETFEALEAIRVLLFRRWVLNIEIPIAHLASIIFKLLLLIPTVQHQVLVEYVYADGKRQFKTLSPENRDERMFWRPTHEKNGEPDASDGYVPEVMFADDIIIDVICTIPSYSNYRFGNYFPYNVKITDKVLLDKIEKHGPLNLPELQINLDTDQQDQYPCMAYALYKAGITEEEASYLVSSFADPLAAQSKALLKKIAETKTFQRYKIYLHYYQKETLKVQSYGKGNIRLDIAFSDGHYFKYSDLVFKDQTIFMNSLKFLHNIRNYCELMEIYRIKTANVTEVEPIETLESSEFRLTKQFQIRGVEIVFADTETYNVLQGNTVKAVPYQICAIGLMGQVFRYTGPDCVQKFLDFLIYNRTKVIYFHNLKFDMSVIIGKLLGKSKEQTKLVMKENTLYEFKLGSMSFRDSYKIIPSPLKSFAKMFNLTVKKEYLNYDWFDNLTIEKGAFKKFYVPYNGEGSPEIANKFLGPKGLDALAYSEEYCYYDCLVLKEGFLKFREIIHEELNLDVFNFLTLSSIADRYLKEIGAYDRVHSVTGVCRAFISRTIKGGVCASRRDQKYKIENGHILDLDATSLYPSAMRLMEGFPIGPVVRIPKGLKYEDIDNKKNAAWLHVRFRNVINDNPFDYVPICSYKDKEKIRYSLEKGIDYYLTFIEIEDLVTYGCVSIKDIEIVDGYWTTMGFNNKINSVIQDLFDIRNSYKKAKNPLEVVIKLVLNSSYGKSILKPSKDNVTIVNNERKEQILRNINDNFVSLMQIAGSDYYYHKTRADALKHTNFGTIGSYILAWSKRIMNKMHDAIHKAGITCYYRDTDSVQIDASNEDLLRIRQKYSETYGSECIGSNLGQFKVDFEVPTVEKPIKSIESYGKRAYYCARKVYMIEVYHEIVYQDGSSELIKKYHCRHKGIPGKVLENPKANLDNYSVLELYDKLHLGQSVTFNLCIGNPSFRMDLVNGIRVLKEFLRVSKCP